MSNYDSDILIQNICKLMKDNGITQVKLAEILGMSQSNVSKALSKSDKKSFTLDQIVGIAKHFHVSIDKLVDNTEAEYAARSPRAIAAFLAALIENGDAKISPITQTELVFRVEYGNNPPYSCSSTQEFPEIEYPAIYLPDYWTIPSNLSEEKYQEMYAEASQVGNDSAMMPVNDFLRKFMSIFEVYQSGGIDEDAYRIVVDNYLSKLRNY